MQYTDNTHFTHTHTHIYHKTASLCMSLFLTQSTYSLLPLISVRDYADSLTCCFGPIPSFVYRNSVKLLMCNLKANKS